MKSNQTVFWLQLPHLLPELRISEMFINLERNGVNYKSTGKLFTGGWWLYSLYNALEVGSFNVTSSMT